MKGIMPSLGLLESFTGYVDNNRANRNNETNNPIKEKEDKEKEDKEKENKKKEDKKKEDKKKEDKEKTKQLKENYINYNKNTNENIDDDFDGGEEFVPDDDTVNIFNFNGLFENNSEESEEDDLDNFIL